MSNRKLHELKEIHYRISYYGESKELMDWIIESISRLPKEVQTFALDRCVYTSVGCKTVAGMVLPGRIGVHHHDRRSRNVWIIVLLEDLDLEEAHATIAHEIAHAWRGDDRLGEPPEDCETQTANLVASWGFTGKGADPGFCNR